MMPRAQASLTSSPASMVNQGMSTLPCSCLKEANSGHKDLLQFAPASPHVRVAGQPAQPSSSCEDPATPATTSHGVGCPAPPGQLWEHQVRRSPWMPKLRRNSPDQPRMESLAPDLAPLLHLTSLAPRWSKSSMFSCHGRLPPLRRASCVGTRMLTAGAVRRPLWLHPTPTSLGKRRSSMLCSSASLASFRSRAPDVSQGRPCFQSEYQKCLECEGSFDYVGSSSSWIHSSSKRDLRKDDTFPWIPLLSLLC